MGSGSGAEPTLSWEELLAIGVLDLGMRPVDFWELTFPELDALCFRRGVKNRAELIGAAMICATLANQNKAKGTKGIWIDDIIGPEPKRKPEPSKWAHVKIDDVMDEVRRLRAIDEANNAAALAAAQTTT